MHGTNRDSIISVSFSLSVVSRKSIFSSVSDAFDAVSELLDKQLFSNSKSDIVTNVFTDAIVKIVQCGQTYQQDDVTVGLKSVPVHLSKGTKS